MSLLLLQSVLSDAIDVGVNLALFLDLQKAFDNDNILHILLRKLQNYYVRAFVLTRLSNYLSNRSKKVFYNNVLSDDVVMDYSVPQGSILGPLLILI